MNGEKAKRTVLAVEIPRDELACRIAEACIGFKRPSGLSPQEALRRLAASQPGIIAGFYEAADRAVLFFRECVNAGRAPS